MKEIKAGVHELSYGLFHLNRSFRYHWEKDKGRGKSYLAAVSEVLPPDSAYGLDGQEVLATQLGAGFHTRVYRFSSLTGEWVMKVGMQGSPIRGFSPASREFADNYDFGLQVQRQIFQPRLPHLVPEPQTVLYVEPVGQKPSSVILQPFVASFLPISYFKLLPLSQQAALRKEMEVLKEGSWEMEREYDLCFDFLRASSHFGIRQDDEAYHLVFLDNGLIEKQRTPIFYLGSRVVKSISLR